MQQYIAAQPQALHAILDDRRKSLYPAVSALAGKRFSRVLLIGAGSSYHTMNMARPFCQAVLSLPVFVCTPAQLGWLTPDMRGDTLVFIASQTGTSTNVLAILRRLRRDGFFVAVLTQVPVSPVAAEADACFAVPIPHEDADPKTMGVTATLLTMQIISMEIALQQGTAGQAAFSFYKDVERMIRDMPLNITATIDWCRQYQPDFLASESYMVVGLGDRSAIAGESALKLIETIRRPAIGYELEEIIHGPMWVFAKGITLLYLSAEDEDQTRPQALRDLCTESGGKAWLISSNADCAGVQGNTLTLRCQNPYLCAYALLLPAQILSAYIPPLLNIDLDLHRSDPYTRILDGHL